MSQTLKRDSLFHYYAKMGYEEYIDVPYFAVKQAVSLQQQDRMAEALTIIQPRKQHDEFSNPQLTAAFSGISHEWATQLLKNKNADIALQVIDSALVYDADNKDLLYDKGVALEYLKQFDKAYEFQQRYYDDQIGRASCRERV